LKLFRKTRRWENGATPFREEEVSRSLFAASLIAALLGLINVVPGQTAIKTFADVAGKWTGQTAPSVHKFTLEIDASGKFRAESALGNESGVARLEGGRIVIPLTEHQGELQLALMDDKLSGSGIIRAKTGTVNLVRAD
jgi:hypothetical protein